MEVTIGGNRLGSGQKMTTELKEYERSTHNLSKRWRSSMGSGMLIPCYRKVMLPEDKFEISVNADCRTIPTKGPLFGSYKMQIDFFAYPLRLCQAILHNNPVSIGLNMDKVRLPKIRIFENHIKQSLGANDTEKWKYYKKEGKMGNSSLLKYLGLSGIGTMEYDETSTIYYRDVDACKILAYYDIYKNYYANKQEEKGYVIVGENFQPFTYIYVYDSEYTYNDGDDTTYKCNNIQTVDYDSFAFISIPVYKGNDEPTTREEALQLPVTLYTNRDTPIEGHMTIKNLIEKSTGINVTINSSVIRITRIEDENWYYDGVEVNFINVAAGTALEGKNGLQIQDFDLKNIDDMRYAILTNHDMGRSSVIYEGSDEFDIYPYSMFSQFQFQYEDDPTGNQYTSNKFGCYGLALKTYQNDIFNNWLNTEWIEGENGINEMTKIATTEGYITIDQISFTTKYYMLLNRVAVMGNTYYDWQSAVYKKIKHMHIESPMFIGGLSKEIVFDEVVQTAPTDVADKDSYLGSLGGRGRVAGGNGEKIIYVADEACIIMGIVSLTPRINYTQGNDFEMTEIDSMDDFHKPAFDGIGFQDLVGERLAYFDTKIDDSGNVTHRTQIGKLPAWVEYMTDYDEAFGDFAEVDGEQAGFMVLNRNYEMDDYGYIKDATTYIDPSKYNYAFAYTSLDAQNFWVEIDFNVKARRLMSARIMPNV